MKLIKLQTANCRPTFWISTLTSFAIFTLVESFNTKSIWIGVSENSSMVKPTPQICLPTSKQLHVVSNANVCHILQNKFPKFHVFNREIDHPYIVVCSQSICKNWKHQTAFEVKSRVFQFGTLLLFEIGSIRIVLEVIGISFVAVKIGSHWLWDAIVNNKPFDNTVNLLEASVQCVVHHLSIRCIQWT